MTEYIEGIDVSKHQGDVNFKATLRAGMKFAFVKCTEGVGHTDPSFAENWRKLVEMDGEYIRGAYHFARPDTGGGAQDGEREAKYFVDVLKKAGDCAEGCFPPALDFEKYSDSGPAENVPWVRSFIHVIENDLGRKPIIYTGRNIWKYELGDTDAFVDCPLWQVDYTEKRDIPKPTPWKQWTFWQWSGGRSKNFDYRYWYKKNGPMPGIRAGFCDVNRFNGSMDDLLRLAMLPPFH